MKEGLVSIIIPLFNRAHLIGETLDSIKNQSYQYWECIVVDDGSIDESCNVVRTYIEKDARIKLFLRPKNKIKGANSCRNYGLQLAKGEFVNFFDSDDLMHNDKLKLQLKSLKVEQTDFNVCQTLVFKGKDHTQGFLRCLHLYSDDPFNDFLAHKIKWLTQAPLLKKNILIELKLTFNETLQQSQELDFFGRMLSHKLSYGIIEKPLVFLREHRDSISYGPFSAKKTISSFNARFYFISEFKKELSIKTRTSLLREVIGLYGIAMRNKSLFQKKELNTMYVELKKEFPFLQQQFLLFLMRKSYYYINKGEYIKARLQAIQ